jgi:hypothetical protein
MVLFAVYLFMSVGAAHAGDGGEVKADQALHIDIRQ